MSAEPAPKVSIPPGATFGRYTIVRELGRGGMGSVYEARHTDLDKRVAIKTLNRKLAESAMYIERFTREGKLAARLDHPHVVSVSDVGTDDGVPFLVMEYLEGRDLADLLEERKKLPPAEAISILLPILAALQCVHDAGLVHRDLKPANIFMCRTVHSGVHPKLLDFGIAKPTQAETLALTGTSGLLGTPLYMAPEQIRDAREAGPRADQYAMGVILYECLTGDRPFDTEGQSLFSVLAMAVGGEIRRPRELAPELPAELETVVVKALANDPANRFASVAELGAALLPFASGGDRQLWGPSFPSISLVETTANPGSVRLPASLRAASSGPIVAQASTDASATSVSQPDAKSRTKLIAVVGAAGLVLGVGLLFAVTRNAKPEPAIAPAGPTNILVPSVVPSAAATTSAAAGAGAGPVPLATSAAPIESAAPSIASAPPQRPKLPPAATKNAAPPASAKPPKPAASNGAYVIE